VGPAGSRRVAALPVANAAAIRIGSPDVTQTATRDEQELLERLRAGDERAFAQLVDACHATMLAVAQAHVRSRAIAEEVVQDAWMGVIRGLGGFEGRSSLKTWILRIVVNTAKTRGVREARSVPFEALASEGDGEPAVEPDRFRGPDDRYPGGWKVFPANWHRLPDETLHQREALEVIVSAITALPPAQRAVIRMRDVEGCSAEEVCAALDVSEGNQRVLLHRARSRVRAALEQHLL
jgi:RNA polymerase sigma-70 factor (ECF subfamily)